MEMKKSNLRERHEEMAEKEEPTLISKKKARHLCKCSKRSKHDPHKATPHTKEVFSDGCARASRSSEPSASNPT